MLLVLTEVGKFLLEIIFDIFRFPWWWYSDGLSDVARWSWRSLTTTRVRVGMGLFLRHFFTPMYGDYSLAGRGISLFMRLGLVFFKLGRLALAVVWYVAVLIGWMLLLPTTLFILFN